MVDESKNPSAGAIVEGLNVAFLDVARSTRAASMGLPEAAVGAVVDLPPAACHRLACIPCTLFGFGLSDPRVLDQMLDGSAPRSDQAPEARAFVLAALSSLLALAATDRDSAAVRFGLPAILLHRLVELGPPVAFRLAPLLRLQARFGACPDLWAGLLAAARKRRPQHLQALQVHWVALSLGRAIGVTPGLDAGHRLYRSSDVRRRRVAASAVFYPARR
jgi:hypothetical protein